MTKDELARVLNIEVALLGKWDTQNGVSLFFEPTAQAGEKGQVEGLLNSLPVGLFEYEVFIKENNPYINIIDVAKEQVNEYLILEIDTAKKLFRIKNTKTNHEMSYTRL